jgi:hypothetical protein
VSSRYIRGVRRRRASSPIDSLEPTTFIVTWIALQGGEIVSVQHTAIKHVIARSDRKPATLLALHGEGGRQWLSHLLNLGGTGRKRQQGCREEPARSISVSPPPSM